MRAAIDSRPLKDNIFETFDYSGLQLHLLSQTPLSFFIKDHATMSGDGRLATIEIIPCVYWSDGSAVTAQDYCNGIVEVLSKNKFIALFYFRNVIKFKAIDNFIFVRLSEPNFKFLEILSIPNFCPFKMQPKFLSSGQYVLESSKNQSWHFVNNPYSMSVAPSLEVCLTDSPNQNLAWYEAGDISVTADTAFPLDRYQDFINRPEFQRKVSGLYCILNFDGRLLGSHDGLELRKFICKAMLAVSWNEDMLCSYTKVSCFHKKIPTEVFHDADFYFNPASLSKVGPLVLAFDGFYPNDIICRLISDKLQSLGLNIKLQEDDYYNPNVQSDIRFTIFRGLGNSDYLKYTSFLLNPVLENNKEAQKAYGAFLLELERSHTIQDDVSILHRLQKILDDNAVIIPLFEIPSLYLTRLANRENPFLTHLVVS